LGIPSFGPPLFLLYHISNMQTPVNPGNFSVLKDDDCQEWRKEKWLRPFSQFHFGLIIIALFWCIAEGPPHSWLRALKSLMPDK
jgi:hypothetical protein